MYIELILAKSVLMIPLETIAPGVSRICDEDISYSKGD